MCFSRLAPGLIILHDCRMNPYGNFFYDGISLEATEVVFLKVKDRLLNLRYSYALHAQHYDKWSLAARQASSFTSPHLGTSFVRSAGHVRIDHLNGREGVGSRCLQHTAIASPQSHGLSSA